LQLGEGSIDDLAADLGRQFGDVFDRERTMAALDIVHELRLYPHHRGQSSLREACSFPRISKRATYHHLLNMGRKNNFVKPLALSCVALYIPY
jgi:hypothetical protein